MDILWARRGFSRPSASTSPSMSPSPSPSAGLFLIECISSCPITEFSPTTAWGVGSSLLVRFNYLGTIVRSLVQFAKPATTVVSATLSLYAGAISPGMVDAPIYVRRVIRNPVVLTTATWLLCRTGPDSPWYTAGAAQAGGDYDVTTVSSLVPGSIGWQDWNVTEIVNESVADLFTDFLTFRLSAGPLDTGTAYVAYSPSAPILTIRPKLAYTT
jgi:hypothetical protein